jgi:capsular exopolysaccharide synthesis family protein
MGNEELGLRHYFDVVWRRRWVAAAVTALGAILAVAFTLSQTPVYRAKTTVLIEREAGLGRLLESTTGDFFLDRSLRTQMELITSRDVLGRAVRSLYSGEPLSEAALLRRTQELKGAVRVGQIAPTDVVEIVARAPEPPLAQARANAVAEAYLAHTVDARIQAVQSALKAASARLSQRADDPSATQIYQQLSRIQRELELAQAAGQIAGIRIVDPALLPEQPEGPRLGLNLLLGLLAGGAIGVVTAFGLEYLDRKVHSDLDLKQAVNLPVLGLIPHWEVQTNPHMATMEKDPKSAFAEAFRVLRTNLQFAGVDRPLRSLLITSPAPSEGKTLVAANLARAFALQGRRVLLVDADLRRPGLRQALGLPEGHGLTTVLTSEEKAKDCTVSLDGMDVMPSGPRPPNPAEVLGSQRMIDLLKELYASYDMIVVDGPPTLGFADALVLGKQVDGTLLLTRAEVTDRGAAA